MADVKRTASKDFRIIAANATRLRMGDNDCGITFILETDDHEGPVLVDEVQISMTPKALKLTNYAISKALAQLEAQMGPIAIPAETFAAIDAEYETVLAAARLAPAKRKCPQQQ